jgi:hypothetical protein
MLCGLFITVQDFWSDLSHTQKAASKIKAVLMNKEYNNLALWRIIC